jgi:hypothetical protein
MTWIHESRAPSLRRPLLPLSRSFCVTGWQSRIYNNHIPNLILALLSEKEEQTWLAHDVGPRVEGSFFAPPFVPPLEIVLCDWVAEHIHHFIQTILDSVVAVWLLVMAAEPVPRKPEGRRSTICGSLMLAVVTTVANRQLVVIIIFSTHPSAFLVPPKRSAISKGHDQSIRKSAVLPSLWPSCSSLSSRRGYSSRWQVGF